MLLTPTESLMRAMDEATDEAVRNTHNKASFNWQVTPRFWASHKLLVCLHSATVVGDLPPEVSENIEKLMRACDIDIPWGGIDL